MGSLADRIGTSQNRECSHLNTTEPFEMDGMKNGEYHASGLLWVCCRTCGRTISLNTLLTRSAVARLRYLPWRNPDPTLDDDCPYSVEEVDRAIRELDDFA